jgi:hypothetical protein
LVNSLYFEYIKTNETGQNLVALLNSTIFTSSDYGSTWSNGVTVNFNNFINEIDADLTLRYIVVGGSSSVDGADYIYRSTDYGISFEPLLNSPQSVWGSITSSSTGQYLVAGQYENLSYKQIWYSSDYGANWNLCLGVVDLYWQNLLVSSYNGQNVIGGAYNFSTPAETKIYISNDYGANFSLMGVILPNTTVDQLTCSSTGQYAYAAMGAYGIYKSTDYGANWEMSNADISNGNYYNSVSTDSTGQYILAYDNSVYNTYLSSDYGVTWILQDTPGALNSGDGGGVVSISSNASSKYSNTNSGLFFRYIVYTMSINLASYPVLNTYVILAGNSISITNSGATTVTNGNMGSLGTTVPGGITFVNGAFDGTSNASTAQTQLTALVNDIAAISTTVVIGTPTITTTQTFTPGKYTTAGTLILQSGGTIVFDAQGNANAQFFIVAATGITFTAGTISLVNGAQAGNVFFVSGAGISNALASQSLFGVLIAQSAITLNTGSSVVGRMFAQTAAITLLGNAITLASTSVVCFLEGTQILTEKGYKSIQNVKVGENVVVAGKIKNKTCDLKSVQLKKVKWMGRFKVYEFNTETAPICFQKNSLGENVPNCDLFVSPNHGMMVDGKIVIAKKLVNDSTIYQSSEIDSIIYYHLELEDHSVIVANGAMTESYLDCKNRIEFKEIAKYQRVIKPRVKKSIVCTRF